MIPINKISEINNDKRMIERREVAYDFTKKLNHQEYIAPVKSDKPRRATFQAAMKLVLLIGQCFGLNPVLGVCEIDTSKLRFTIYSGRFLYTSISILGQLWLVCLCLMKLVKIDNPSLSSNTSLVFFASNCLTTILFVRIAMQWPKLSEHIARLEASDPNMDFGLVKRCNISCIVVLSLALVEHILSDTAGLAVAIDCQPDTNIYEAFILQSFPWVWTFMNYNHFVGFLAQGPTTITGLYSIKDVSRTEEFFNLQCTFNWNFADAFVICISWYLTARLKQVNNRIVAVRGKYVTTSFWRMMREDYSKATSLVRRVDSVISGIIFISFANNLFFICLQLLHILEDGVKANSACHRNPISRPLRGFEQAVYFLYSFGFLMARSLAVSLIAAQVHTASKLPAQSLYDVPSASYCVEVQRIIDQLHGDTVALSGLQFFNVKRGLVLTIAGTIVTYELVLMQFAGVTPTSSPATLPPLLIPNSTPLTT